MRRPRMLQLDTPEDWHAAQFRAPVARVSRQTVCYFYRRGAHYAFTTGATRELGSWRSS